MPKAMVFWVHGGMSSSFMGVSLYGFSVSFGSFCFLFKRRGALCAGMVKGGGAILCRAPGVLREICVFADNGMDPVGALGGSEARRKCREQMRVAHAAWQY